MIEKLKVVVRNKTKVFLQTDCSSVSMESEVGPFDVLPEHANMVAVIKGEVLARPMSGKEWKVVCTKGVVRVTGDVVDVVILEM